MLKESDVFSYLVSNEIQELIILPTEQCNFRCTYCYEDYILKRMSPEIVIAIKNFLARRVPKAQHLIIRWFGGEPLVAKDILIDIGGYAKNLALENNLVSYMSTVTTNGFLLTPSTLGSLIDVGITKFQITLDGPKEIHNQTRKKANNEGSYDQIWDNLLYIKKSNISVGVTLRIHLFKENLPYIPDFLKLIKKTFLEDPRFEVLLMPLANFGGQNEKHPNVIAKNMHNEVIRNLEKIIYENEKKKNREELEICYAARPNSIVIRSDGSLAKCTIALKDERNNIGEIDAKGTLSINQERLGNWLRGLYSQDKRDLKCPLRTLL